MEQFVLQELASNHSLYYWSKPNSRQEVDFLLQSGSKIIPVEVKAEVNLKAKSLHQFIIENETEVAVRTSMMPYRKETNLTNVPLYAVDAFFSV